MTTFLPEDVRRGLELARERDLRKKSRLRVGEGPDAIPILTFDEDRFSVPMSQAPALRGLVDIYEGARHLYQALIIASQEDGDRMVYEFKRVTAAAEKAALDHYRPADAPVALIPRLAL